MATFRAYQGSTSHGDGAIPTLNRFGAMTEHQQHSCQCGRGLWLSLRSADGAHQHRRGDRYDREHNSGPLPAPAVTITPALKRAWAPPPALHGKIPVLVYHGIDSGSSPGQVTQTEFAR